MRKGLIALLLCTFLLPLLLWLALPWGAQYLLQHWLLQQGFEQPRLELQHPSWDRLRIDHLSVEQRNDERHLQLSARHIELRFTPWALLQGQIQELRIEQAYLGIHAQASLKGRVNELEQTAAPVELTPLDPTQLFRYAPSQRLVIAELELDYRAPEQPRFQARGNIDLEPGLLQSRLRLDREGEALGYLDLSLDPKLNLSLSLSRDNRYLLRSAHQLNPAASGWQLRSDLLLELDQLELWRAQLQPDLALPVSEPGGQLLLQSRLQLPNPLPTSIPELINSLSAQLKSRLALTTLQGPAFNSSQTDIALDASLKQGAFTLKLQPDSQISARGLQQADTRLAEFAARLQQPIHLEGHWQQPADWQLSSIALSLAPRGLELGQPLQLAFEPIQLTLASGPLLRARYDADLKLPDVHLTPEGQPALNLDLQAQLSLEPGTHTLSGQGHLGSQQLPLGITFEGELAFAGRQDKGLNGQVAFQLADTALADLHTALRPWLPTTLKPLSIEQGRFSAQGKFKLMSADWSLDTAPEIKGLQLTWDEHTRIYDLNLSQRLQLDARGQLRSQGRLDLDHTDTGLRIFGPQLDFDLRLPQNGTPRLSLSSFSLSVLDGIIAVPPLSFNPLQPQFDTRIAVSALELERMLELYPQEGLYGSGVLGGALPLQINGNQLRITNGQLISQGQGGVIRYQATPEILIMGRQNPGIQLALDALTDFRFDLLDLTLDYAPGGDALMRARLKGRNPTWQQGRPVDLNLNIEENLLDLLRTLRLTDQVTDAIDRRFRR